MKPRPEPDTKSKNQWLGSSTKSSEYWDVRLAKDSEGGRGTFRLLTRETLNSKAFRSLSKGAIIVVLSMLDKLNYEKRITKDRKNVKQNKSNFKNGGEFKLSNSELKARGICSDATIAQARRECHQKGFYDVLVTGTPSHSGSFKYSERWRDYPGPKSLPTDKRIPGKNPFVSHFDTSKNEVGATSKNEVHLRWATSKNEVQGVLKTAKATSKNEVY